MQILEVGASIPWHACALGKAVVAFGPSVSPERAPGRRALAADRPDPDRAIGAADRARGGRRRWASRWRIRRRSSARPRSRRRCSIIEATPPVRSASWDRWNGSSRTARRRRWSRRCARRDAGSRATWAPDASPLAAEAGPSARLRMMGDAPRFVTVDDYEPVARERLAGRSVRLLRRRRRRRVDARGESPRVRSMEAPAAGPPRRRAGPIRRRRSSGRRVSFPVLVAPLGVPVDGASRRRAGDRARGGRRGHDHGRVLHGDRRVGGRGVGDRGAEVVAAVRLRGPRRDGRRCSRAWWTAGYDAICLTVDLPVLGLRHRDTRNGFGSPIGPRVLEVAVRPMLTWDDIGVDPRADRPDCRSW